MDNRRKEYAMRSEKTIKPDLYDLYSVYSQYKMLHQFWEEHQLIKGENEIRERIKYILKNKVKQKDEITTLLWVLGEDNENRTGN